MINSNQPLNSQSLNHLSHECPICGGQVELDESTMLHELIECIDCGSELEVTAINPFFLSEAPTAGEDWGQ